MNLYNMMQSEKMGWIHLVEANDKKSIAWKQNNGYKIVGTIESVLSLDAIGFGMIKKTKESLECANNKLQQIYDIL